MNATTNTIELINIRGEKMIIGNSVSHIITNEIGVIADIYLTDRGYSVKLENGNFDYAHRFVNN